MRWIPVTAQLPPPYTDVLGFTSNGQHVIAQCDGGMVIVDWDDDDKEFYTYDPSPDYEVTHWQPLPLAPGMQTVAAA